MERKTASPDEVARLVLERLPERTDDPKPPYRGRLKRLLTFFRTPEEVTPADAGIEVWSDHVTQESFTSVSFAEVTLDGAVFTLTVGTRPSESASGISLQGDDHRIRFSVLGARLFRARLDALIAQLPPGDA